MTIDMNEWVCGEKRKWVDVRCDSAWTQNWTEETRPDLHSLYWTVNMKQNSVDVDVAKDSAGCEMRGPKKIIHLWKLSSPHNSRTTLLLRNTDLEHYTIQRLFYCYKLHCYCCCTIHLCTIRHVPTMALSSHTHSFQDLNHYCFESITIRLLFWKRQWNARLLAYSSHSIFKLHYN